MLGECLKQSATGSVENYKKDSCLRVFGKRQRRKYSIIGAAQRLRDSPAIRHAKGARAGAEPSLLLLHPVLLRQLLLHLRRHHLVV